MTHTFKIRYANVLVGSLVLFVIALLVVATIFIGAKKQWFKSPFTIEATLPYRRTLGLKVGTSVFLMDSIAGEVEALHFHHDGNISATLRMKDVFRPFIRTNALGIVRKEFAVVGEQRIVLTQKEEGPTYADFEKTAPLSIQPDVDIVAALLKTADRISAEVPKLIEDAGVMAANLRRLTGELADPTNGVQPAMVEATAAIKRFRLLLETAQTGKGFTSKVLNDPAFATSVQNVTDGLASTLANLRQTLDHIRLITQNVPQVLTSANGALVSVKGAAEDVRPLLKSSNEAILHVPAAIDHADAALQQAPALMMQLQSAVDDLQTLLQGLQHNWLLKGGVNEAKRLQLENVSTNAPLFHP